MWEHDVDRWRGCPCRPVTQMPGLFLHQPQQPLHLEVYHHIKRLTALLSRNHSPSFCICHNDHVSCCSRPKHMHLAWYAFHTLALALLSQVTLPTSTQLPSRPRSSSESLCSPTNLPLTLHLPAPVEIPIALSQVHHPTSYHRDDSSPLLGRFAAELSPTEPPILLSLLMR